MTARCSHQWSRQRLLLWRRVLESGNNGAAEKRRIRLHRPRLHVSLRPYGPADCLRLRLQRLGEARSLRLRGWSQIECHAPIHNADGASKKDTRLTRGTVVAILVFVVSNSPPGLGGPHPPTTPTSRLSLPRYSHEQSWEVTCRTITWRRRRRSSLAPSLHNNMMLDARCSTLDGCSAFLRRSPCYSARRPRPAPSAPHARISSAVESGPGASGLNA